MDTKALVTRLKRENPNTWTDLVEAYVTGVEEGEITVIRTTEAKWALRHLSERTGQDPGPFLRVALAFTWFWWPPFVGALAR